MRPYRQGDVLLVPVDRSEARTTRDQWGFSTTTARVLRRRRGEGIIVASGEQSGHHHRAREARARLIRKGNKLYLTTSKSEPVVLTHEEHDPITLPAGSTFEIVRQREHVPPERPTRGRRGSGRQSSGSRRVAD